MCSVAQDPEPVFGTGYLFNMRGAALCIPDGSMVDRWKARYLEGGLELVSVQYTDDLPMRARERRTSVCNEVKQRKLEVLALRTQCSKLSTQMEHVRHSSMLLGHRHTQI